MAQIISVKSYEAGAGRRADDFLSPSAPLTVRDFMDLARAPLEIGRRSCLAGDQRVTPPQSQVDRLISDLMDMIVRNPEEAADQADAPRSEGAALSMMQALLQKQLCSSF